jgi:hypothetical protein
MTHLALHKYLASIVEERNTLPWIAGARKLNGEKYHLQKALLKKQAYHF